MVAGEASGDLLGAGVLKGLKQLGVQVEAVGVGGPEMLAEGLEPLADMDQLAVNGFTEPLTRLPSLLKLLRMLRRELSERRVDGFLGVDFNVFNFLLERALKRRGVPTAHYVSPSVYAWRRGRVKRIARSTDLLLALYPFEPALYAETAVQVAYVGHPLADSIELDAGSAANRQLARQALQIPEGHRCIALLPGSRGSELRQMLPLFLDAASRLNTALQPVTFVLPSPRALLRGQVQQALLQYPQLSVVVDPQPARRALTAAEAALVKSGTSTLEALLLRCPMVVSYRLGSLSYQVVRRLLRTPYIALPNILAQRPLVPEVLQNEATPDRLATCLLEQLDRVAAGADYQHSSRLLHESLRCNANLRAAEALLSFLRPEARVA